MWLWLAHPCASRVSASARSRSRSRASSLHPRTHGERHGAPEAHAGLAQERKRRAPRPRAPRPRVPAPERPRPARRGASPCTAERRSRRRARVRARGTGSASAWRLQKTRSEPWLCSVNISPYRYADLDGETMRRFEVGDALVELQQKRTGSSRPSRYWRSPRASARARRTARRSAGIAPARSPCARRRNPHRPTRSSPALPTADRRATPRSRARPGARRGTRRMSPRAKWRLPRM